MRIKSKLIIAFLVVGIVPMLTAVPLSIFFINLKLNQNNTDRLKDAVELIKSREEQSLSRTDFAAEKLANDKEYQEKLAKFEETVTGLQELMKDENTPPDTLQQYKLAAETTGQEIRKRMTEIGSDFKAIDYGISVLQTLDRDQLMTYVSNSTQLKKKKNPIWQGYTLETSENGEIDILATSIDKIDYQGHILGGTFAGIPLKKSLVDVINESSLGVNPSSSLGISASIIYPNSVYPKNDPENARLYDTVFKLGKEFSSNNIPRSNIPYHLQCFPLKDQHGKVLGGIIVGFQLPTVTEVWNKYKYLFYELMVVVVSILAIILGYIIARGISNPIRRLVGGVEQISKGNLDYRIQVRSHDEMRDLSTAINRMAEELKQKREMESQIYTQDKLASLGQLTAGIAHEIRNPLGSIKSYAGILRDTLLRDGKEREIAQVISDQVDRLNEFITNFLNFAKTQEPKIVSTYLEVILDRTIKLVQAQYPKEKYPIELSSQSQNGYVTVDPQQIQQVFLNLIINAWQAMPNGGLLKITYTPNPDKKLFKIIFQDQGKGISEDDLKKIFKPFFTTRQDGTGLGLWIVQQIIERHNGQLEVESAVGKGTKFIIYLPMENSKLEKVK
jgi:signal transduction histidine kinase